MKMLGYPQLGAESFVCVRDENDLATAQGQILCFERIQSSESLLLQCTKAGLKTALWVRCSLDILWGLNYGVTYLLAPLGTTEQNLVQWQRILQDYLSDCIFVREIVGTDEELLSSLQLGLDAVVCSSVIKNIP